MSIDKLNSTFSIPDHISFKEEVAGLPVVEIKNAHATATLALQGAHLLTWQPKGQEPVIWLSPEARFAKGKSVRGGVPVCWPWFGPHETDSSLPAHGFARTVLWEVRESRMLENGESVIKLAMIQNETTKSQWPEVSTVELKITIGQSLKLELLTCNTGNKPFKLSEALHTYFNISDIQGIVIKGLEGCEYLDKVDNFARKIQDGSIAIESEVDRVYVNTQADCLIQDGGLNRNIRISCSNANSTIVWNPWIEKANQMGDLGADGYRKMVCVESGNAAENTITLEPGQEHCLVVEYRVELAN